jgi:hypothetical protein
MGAYEACRGRSSALLRQVPVAGVLLAPAAAGARSVGTQADGAARTVAAAGAALGFPGGVGHGAFSLSVQVVWPGSPWLSCLLTHDHAGHYTPWPAPRPRFVPELQNIHEQSPATTGIARLPMIAGAGLEPARPQFRKMESSCLRVRVRGGETTPLSFSRSPSPHRKQSPRIGPAHGSIGSAHW